MYFRIEKRKSTPLKIALQIIISLLFLVNFNVIGQNSENIENYTFDELSDKYYEYKFTDSLKAKKFANFYFKKAIKEKDTVNAIDGKYYLSEVHKNDSIYINYLDSLISKTRSNPNKMYPTYAFLKKGNLFFNNELYNVALKNYILASSNLKKNKNDSLNYLLKIKISTLKNFDHKNSESLKILLECNQYYINNKNKVSDNKHSSVLINISILYAKLKKIDSSNIFINKAIEFAYEKNDNFLKGYCYYLKGRCFFEDGAYKKTILNIKKSIPYLIIDENYRNLSLCYSYIAKSYEKLNKKNNALKYHFLVDSLYFKTKIPSKRVKNSFNYISNHYKNKGDLKNQLRYIEKLIFVDSIQEFVGKNLSKTFTEEYDRPKLIAEKQKIISELNNEVSFYKKSRVYIGLVLIISLIVVLHQFKKRKKQEQKFENLLLKLKNKKELKISTTDSTKNQKSLPETIVSELLSKLDSFEKKADNYTNKKLTLSSLAKELETNSNYLSKVINQQKGYNFSTYLRKLRIEYALNLLEKDETIRKYSIDAIAREVGFKNAETFSKAFFKETELNPSYYIKQLDKKK